MLQKCRRDQWHIDDLDWSTPAQPMSAAKEEAVVQFFTDMAGIERLAGALFAEQRRRMSDPVLHEIFTTFIRDEERHAQVAQRLADYYNRNQFRDYKQNPNLARFRPHFVDYGEDGRARRSERLHYHRRTSPRHRAAEVARRLRR